MSPAAVFLDKDGTVVEDVPYNVEPDRLQLAPGAAKGLRRLYRARYRLIIVSNQSGIARGLFLEDALDVVARRLEELFALAGARLDGFYYCPHHPAGTVSAYSVPCICRKPAPGLLYRAARDHAIDLQRSWMVGDILDDVQAGRRAGCRTILLDNGGESEWIISPDRVPDYVAADLDQASRLITSLSRRGAQAGDEREQMQCSGADGPTYEYQSPAIDRSV